MLAAELDEILLENVVELSFVKKTDGSIRNMVCTKSYSLLNSVEGINKLGYVKPKGNVTYDLKAANNLVVWDIDKKNYRTVSCDTVTVKNVIPKEQYLAFLRLND